MKVTDRWFNRLVVAAVSIGFLALIAAGFAATQAILQNQDQTRWVNHTYQVERAISRFRVLEERLEAARRGYLLRNEHGLSATFTDTANEIGPALSEIRRLVADNPRQQENVAFLTELSRQHMRTLARSVALVSAGRRAEAVETFNHDSSLPMIRAIREGADQMLAEEDRLLTVRNAEQRASLLRFFIILSASGALLLVVAGGSIWIIIRYTNDLTSSRDALTALNANLEGAVRERTADLQRANDEIQRFAYIVSHDLRSPLVNVMGFTAELEAASKRLSAMMDRVEARAPDIVDAEDRLAAREDLPEAIGFIRTSTQKMDRLINAILRLSREGRRPITPEQLDMDGLMAAVVGTLRHRIDELGIEVTIAPSLPGLTSDRLAVEQVMANIVENAIKYLQPGRPGRIEIRGQREGARATFEIADNGRGIDPKDHERIFDLFRRSGQQDQPGEGIGLAHTRALAYRLGGTINVESELGKGATFRINLPIHFAGDQGAMA
ncbi:sensor histidine kinase [Sphingomonas crusticola]|uniref:sensor histidine kinase n=1 Tax=Sphingomonas crusticola TaxID=1697973 RepID=UPI000E2563AD|nr:sensor histidine kinase [Sphingomonas crusticola]